MLLKNKIILSILLFSTLFISGCSAPVEVQDSIAILETIPAVDFKKLIDSRSEDSMIVDIRTQTEFEFGHLEDAKMIDFYSSNFKDKLAKLDKEKIYYIYCRSGSRSSLTLEIMKELGFKEVYELEGGITSWENNNFKLVK